MYKVKSLVLVILFALMALISCQNATNTEPEATPTPPPPPEKGLPLTMVTIPAGRFQRTNLAGENSVITQPYQLSAHEITRAQFLAVMGTDPSDTNYSSSTSDPVQMVNSYHAIAFCNKLSLSEGLTPVYSVNVSGTPINWTSLTYASIPTTDNADWNAATVNWSNNGYRLPTEMEWMWAAMGAPADGQGGGTNTTGYEKQFAGSTGSNVIGNYAVFGYNSGEVGATSTQKSNPVGSKTANELGLYDMSGNVWEWCWDWYATWPNGILTDYRGPTSGTERPIYGGAWHTTDVGIKTWAINEPSSRYFSAGFRVARS